MVQSETVYQRLFQQLSRFLYFQDFLQVFNRLSKCEQKISEYESLDQFISSIFLFKLKLDSLLTF